MKTTLALVAVAVAAALPAHAADSLSEAFLKGKTSLDTRLRFEYVEDDSKVETKGQAFTNRLVLGYRTDTFAGFSAGIEFENITALIDDDKYNSAPPAGAKGEGNANTAYPNISDPYLTQVNQAWVDFMGLKVGRQKIVFDNARFIGDVGWRQNDQTYDAALYTNKTLIPMTQFSVGYLTRVHNIFGADRDLKAPVVNIRVSPNATNNIALFYYGVEEESLPATSWSHLGVRADGTPGDFIYDISWAQQSDYADGTTLDADYYDVQLGYKFGPVTLKGQYEVLEKGFKTPFATLHAFNGWADRFLTTPTDGLKDMNIKVLTTLAGTNFVLAYHQFSAEATSQDFGQELNLSIGRKFSDQCSGLIKYAAYMSEAGAPAALGKDVSKLWLQVQYKFM